MVEGSYSLPPLPSNGVPHSSTSCIEKEEKLSKLELRSSSSSTVTEKSYEVANSDTRKKTDDVASLKMYLPG